VQSLKTYQLYHGEWLQAEGKMRHVENQKMKLERQQSAGSGVAVAKSALSRRFRNFEKLSEKASHLAFESCQCTGADLPDADVLGTGSVGAVHLDCQSGMSCATCVERGVVSDRWANRSMF